MKTPRVQKSEPLMRVELFRPVHSCCRCNLAGVMLQLMALGISDVINFDFMSKPSPGNDAFWLSEPLATRRHIAVPTFWCLSRGHAFGCGAFGAARSRGEEGRSGSPHCFGEEDGKLSSRTQICQGKTVFPDIADSDQTFLTCCVCLQPHTHHTDLL